MVMRNGNYGLKTLDKKVDAIPLLEGSYIKPNAEELKHDFGKFWKLRYAFEIRKAKGGFFNSYKSIINDKTYQK